MFHIILKLEDQFIDYKLDAKEKILNHRFRRQPKRSSNQLEPKAQLLQNEEQSIASKLPPISPVTQQPQTNLDSPQAWESDLVSNCGMKIDFFLISN